MASDEHVRPAGFFARAGNLAQWVESTRRVDVPATPTLVEPADDSVGDRLMGL